MYQCSIARIPPDHHHRRSVQRRHDRGSAIAQRQGGDLTWLAPYWPAIQTWYKFLITLLPFPQEQLSTDDFDGDLYNATNLAVKGVAAIAAYGYIIEKFTGNATAGAEAYAIAASYASTMVDYSWHNNGSDSHFLIGYKGSKGDGGDIASWPMLYNAVVRINYFCVCVL